MGCKYAASMATLPRPVRTLIFQPRRFGDKSMTRGSGSKTRAVATLSINAAKGSRREFRLVRFDTQTATSMLSLLSCMAEVGPRLQSERLSQLVWLRIRALLPASAFGTGQALASCVVSRRRLRLRNLGAADRCYLQVYKSD